MLTDTTGRRRELADRLQWTGRPLVLDGAMGTELLRRGVPTPLPLWSAPANVKRPSVVEAIHAGYVAAGCDLITTNTFRTSRYALERSARGDSWPTWNRQAVRLARRAAGDRAWVLGSVTTLEDCYRPDLVPDQLRLQRYHARQIDLLARLPVDGLLLETFNTLRELSTAFACARRHDLPVLVSALLRDGGHLYDGTPILKLVDWARRAHPDALLVNCAAPEVLDAAVQYLLRHLELPLGAYANVGEPGGEMGFAVTHAYSPAVYAAWSVRWVNLGLQIIGGCCGTTPAYMQVVAGAVRRAAATPSPP
jgi:S-methylmethionine-dependent homocysteine/selenocysteine methylase